MGTILIGRITLPTAATAEAQDLRRGAHSNARFEKSRRRSEDLETAPSATAEDLETRRPDGKPNDSRLRQRSSELVARHSSATAEARITKTSDPNTTMRVAR